MGVTSKDGSDGSEGSEGKEGGSDRMLAQFDSFQKIQQPEVAKTCSMEEVKSLNGYRPLAQPLNVFSF